MGFFFISKGLLLGCMCRRGRTLAGCAWLPSRHRGGTCEKDGEMEMGLVTS